jgi:peptidoglycan/LPS O-acetylase OafA/YrhL
MITFTLVLLFIKAAFLLYAQGNDAEWVKSVKKFLAMSKLESMSIGGIGAWILYSKRDDLLKFVYHPVILTLSLIGIPALIYITPLSLQNVVYLAYSVCSVIIILNFAGNVKLKTVLENKILDFLGKISFGIYMYHMLVVTLVLNFSRDYLKLGYYPEGAIRREVTLYEDILIYTLVIGLTILLASLSYLYFEKRFIKMKWKVAKVISGDHAK